VTNVAPVARQARMPSPLEEVQGAGVSSIHSGALTVYFSRDPERRAEQLADSAVTQLFTGMNSIAAPAPTAARPAHMGMFTCCFSFTDISIGPSFAS